MPKWVDFFCAYKGNEAVQEDTCAVGVKAAAKIDPEVDIPSVWLTMAEDKLPYQGTYAYAIKTLAGMWKKIFCISI